MSLSLRAAVLWLVLCPVAAQEPPRPSVQTFAGPELAGQAVALATDDRGRLYLSCTQRWLREAASPEMSESAVCLTDRDGDGHADTRTVIADGFSAPVDGPAGGILPLHSGGVLFGCSPTLWRLADDDADLRADRRLPLLNGIGTQPGMSIPGLRAITEGPDGWIYFTASARGCHIQTAEGPRYAVRDSGAVFRCLPDGANLEMLATGLHDPAGIAVDGRGRVFVADAAPEQTSTRILQVLPGADFGWSSTLPGRAVFTPGNRPAWMLPELGILPGRATGLIVAPVLNETTRLPALIMADGRTGGGVIPLSLTGTGPVLSVAAGAPLWQGGAVSGLTAAPDGSLLWADWGAGFSATATSRILRLPPAGNMVSWKASADLLADSLQSKDIPALLEDVHPLVQRRAREALTARGFLEALDPLTRTAKRARSLPARLNALWGLAALARSEPVLVNEVLLFFTSAEPDIRTLAVHLTGELQGDVPAGSILAMLRDESLDVRTEAALAIARLHPPSSANALKAALIACGDDERFLRHALTYALSRVLLPAEITLIGSEASSLRVKAAAVQALRMLRSAELGAFLKEDDPAIVRAAATAITDGGVTPAFPALALSLRRCAEHPALLEPGFVRSTLLAAHYCGTPEAAEAVADFAGLVTEKVPGELRAAAVATLSAWDVPAGKFPVPGSIESPLPRPAGVARPHLLRLQPDTARTQPGVEKLAAAIADAKLSDAARIDALQQLAALQPAKALEISRAMMPGNGTAALRASARTIIMKLDANASYTQLNEAIATGSPQEMQAVIAVARRFDSKHAEAAWLDLGKQFLAGHIAPEARLEVLEGLTQRDLATRGKFRRLLETIEAAYDEEADPLARWRLCESGGDPDKGRIVFETSLEANCTDCHSLRGHGGNGAPELDGVASRLNREQLLASLIRPSSRIATGYGEVTITLDDSTSHHGILRQRDDSILLLSTPLGPRRLPAAAVQSISPPVSPMPSMSTLLTPREVRDLLAWLETLK